MLARAWACGQTQDLPLSELLAPYERAFELLANPALALQGVAFQHADQLLGLYVWEQPDWRPDMAVGLISLTSRRVRGLAEYQHVVMCALLADIGVPRLCIGGAETAGLDAFKRKFEPVHSVALTSAVQRGGPTAMAQGMAA